jgi:hypothetical protein
MIAIFSHFPRMGLKFGAFAEFVTKRLVLGVQGLTLEDRGIGLILLAVLHTQLRLKADRQCAIALPV